MTKMKTLVIYFLLFLFLALSSSNIFAGTNGKISGVILDSKTGQPIIGANVIVLGTTLGAATDVSGAYFVLNVPPGIYSVRASFMGYRSEIKSEVKVAIDRTTQVNFNLYVSDLETDEVVVTAQKEIVRLDVSGTQTSLDVSNIEGKPLTTFAEVLSLSSGVALSSTGRRGTGISIRGGGIDETDFRVDGISLKDPLSQNTVLQLPQSSIVEAQVLTGGFNAEYGGVRSGLVNVVTKEGSFEKYEAKANVRYGKSGRKHFGPNAFDKNGRIWQVYAGDKAFVGTNDADVTEWEESGGASGYPFVFRGWNAIANDYATDDNPNNDITPQHALELWKYRHRPIDYGNDPDYTVDFGIGGPIPFLNSTSFFFSYRHENIAYPYPLSRKNELNDIGILKLTSKISNKLKINLSGIYGVQQGSAIGFLNNLGKISGEYWGSVSGTASGYRGASESSAAAFGYRSMYNEGYYSQRDNYFLRVNLEGTYVFSKSTFATLSYQFGKNWVETGHMGMRDTSRTHKIGGIYYDDAPRGWVSSLTSFDQTQTFYMQGGGQRFDESSTIINSLKFELTSQLDKHNQVKVGAGVTVNNIKSRSAIFWLPTYQSVEVAPWTWQYWDGKPIEANFFVQDKLEFEGMIANIGLRADMMNPNTNAFRFDEPYDGYYTTDKFSVGTVNDLWFKSRRTEPAKTQIKLQPRLGVSFPTSVKGKLYFNYGHFYQRPDYYKVYSMAVTGGGAPGFLAAFPNSDWPRTIQYEVGFEQDIYDLFLVRVAGYYKDITGQSNLRRGINWDETVDNHIWSNNNYGDIKGIEFSFNKPYGNYVTFWSNLNYMVSSFATTSLDIIYENPFKAEEEKYYIQKTKPIPTINFNAGLSLHSPKRWSQFFLDKLTLSLLFSFEDGGEFIINPEAPTDKQHYLDIVDYSNLDLKIEKGIQFAGVSMMVYLDVSNLLNQKFLFTGGFTFQELNNYKQSLHLPWNEGDKKGDDKWGDFPDDGSKDHINIGFRNWSQFLNPRRIDFGLKIKL